MHLLVALNIGIKYLFNYFATMERIFSSKYVQYQFLIKLNIGLYSKAECTFFCQKSDQTSTVPFILK